MNLGEEKQKVVDVFDRAAPSYDRVGVEFFGLFGARLVELAALVPGQRVLDLGCGRGAVLFPAAEAVGATGSVVGVDAAPGMVGLTADEARRCGLRHARVRLGDAEDPPGEPGEFDAVLAGLVLFFLPDLDLALRRYARLLTAGGTLAFSWFGPDDTRWKPVFDAVARFAPPAEPANARRPDGPWTDPERITAVLHAAGFSEICTTETTYDITIEDVHQWWSWSLSHGGRDYFEQFPAEVLGDVLAAADAAMDGVRRPDGTLSLRALLRITTARSARHNGAISYGHQHSRSP